LPCSSTRGHQVVEILVATPYCTIIFPAPSRGPPNNCRIIGSQQQRPAQLPREIERAPKDWPGRVFTLRDMYRPPRPDRTDAQHERMDSERESAPQAQTLRWGRGGTDGTMPLSGVDCIFFLVSHLSAGLADPGGWTSLHYAIAQSTQGLSSIQETFSQFIKRASVHRPKSSHFHPAFATTDPRHSNCVRSPCKRPSPKGGVATCQFLQF